MAEDEEIRLRIHRGSPLIQRFRFSLELIPLAMCKPGMQRPAVSQRKSKTNRDKGTEEPLGHAAAENSLHAFVDMHPRAEAVTMGKHERPSGMDYTLRTMMNLDTHALEIMIAPDVMVAAEEMHLDTTGNKRLESSEYAGIPGRNDITVFIPEIPDIAKHVKSLGFLFRDRFEKAHKPVLPCTRVAHVESQMDIRKEVYALAHSCLCKNEYCGRHHGTVDSEPAELRLFHESDHHLAGKETRDESGNEA